MVDGKLVFVSISPALVLKMLTGCNHIHATCTNGLEPSSEFVGVTYDGDDIILKVMTKRSDITEDRTDFTPEFTSINCSHQDNL